MSDADEFEDGRLDVVVPEGLDGVRCDRALAMLTGRPRALIAAVIATGAVSVDGGALKKASTPLISGQRLVATLPDVDDGWVEPDGSVPVDVVAESVDFIVVNKAPGQVVHPGAGQRAGTLVAGLLARYPELDELRQRGLGDPSRPGVVHRLDKGTSGLLVVARSSLGYERLHEQLAERAIERIYIGLVEGHVAESRGVVDAPIGRSTRTPTMMAVRADGRWARTAYEVLSRLDSPRTTVLRLKLETGRTHQIRVHLASIGHPVVNDNRYGHRREPRLEAERVFLHATQLGFHDPSTGAWTSFDAALPEDLAALISLEDL